MTMEATDFTPRAYQVDLYEKAVDNNLILFLPTGSGKTFISVLLIKKYSNQVQLPFNEGGKRIFFIVNTVPLVWQQSNYIARLTGLATKAYCADMLVDSWSKDKWLKEIQEHQVLVMVADIFLILLNHGIMPLDSVCLIIFDECHKAVGDQPMRRIMKCFELYDKQQYPRILGLTATLLNSNVDIKEVEHRVRELEITFHAKVATVNSSAALRCYGNVKESIVFHEPPVLCGIEDKIAAFVEYMLKVIAAVQLKETFDENQSSEPFKPKSKNTKLINLVKDLRENVRTMGLYGGSKGVLMHMIQLESIKKFADNPQTLAVIEFLVTQMTKIRKLMNDWMSDCPESEQIYKFSTDKLLKTFDVLRQSDLDKGSDKFCCIIFVQRRTTAQILYHVLKSLHRLSEDFKFLLPEFTVGGRTNPLKDTREAVCISKWNKEALRRIQTGQSNCLIATDVIDEGMDIPSCNLTLRYDLPTDFRSFIQSKGRTRDKNGLFTMLVSQTHSKKFAKSRNNYQQIHTLLNQILVQSEERPNVSAEETEQSLYNTEMKPYTVIGVDGSQATVSGISAISLISVYCSSLLKSQFVTLTPTWKLHTIQTKASPRYKVSLTLPPTSPLRETIEGDEMQTIALAKRSAALKTCIKLHQMQEFTDRLLPKSPTEILSSTEYLFPNWEDEAQEEQKLAGTRARKRLHKTICPSPLHGAFPVPEVQLYLHIIDVKPTYPKPYENRAQIFYDLLNGNAGFGILSTKPMPKIPNFPIFMNVGEMIVRVRVNDSKCTLLNSEIVQLRIFHWLIFHDVLQIIKNFMAFDTQNLDNSFLVVPTNDKGQIDWDVVMKYKKIDKVPLAENMNVGDLELSLVTPSYRDSSSVYVVTQVCEDIFAESCFPTEDFYSYVHYYKERHGLVIRDPKQPMLEVKAISTHINCIRPRIAKTNARKRRHDDVLEGFQEHFVGELCDRIDFPALYWLKASYIPSVLHRINQLLVAEELRRQIIVEAHLGTLKSQSWPAIIVKQNDDEEPMPDDLLEVSGWSGDDSVTSTNTAVDISGPEIDTLGLDSKLYPWTKDQEPVNIFRDIDEIRLIDIEYYHQFALTPMNTDNKLLYQRGASYQFERKPTVEAPPLNVIGTEASTGPSPGFIMEALTSKEANDVVNLERLETLGDCFLKFAATLYLFETFPGYNEGQLTTIKGRIIGNRNLFYCGKNKQIPGRLKIDDFAPNSNFTPPTYCAWRQVQRILLENKISPNVLYEVKIPPKEQLAGIPSERTLTIMQDKVLSWSDSNTQTEMQHFLGHQVVSDKSVADSVEALIGVYLSSMGIAGAFKLITWFGILPPKLKVDVILHEPSRSAKLGLGDPSDHLPQAAFIEKAIGYEFKDRAYLLQAFTHPSYTPNNITTSYEKLEFLGDAVIDFLITTHIFETCGDLSPGALTDLRSALVNNITLSCLTVKYGLHTALLSYAINIQGMIERFVKFQEERGHVIDDELLWILLEEEECQMAEYVDVPKVLGDIFESVIGAIFLDTGKDLNKTWDILYGLMSKEIAAFSRNVPKQPIRVIHETPGAKPRFSKPSPVDGTDVVMVTLEVEIAGKTRIYHGFGGNKKQAKCAAAKQALKCIRQF